MLSVRTVRTVIGPLRSIALPFMAGVIAERGKVRTQKYKYKQQRRPPADAEVYITL